jgi:hypothetical protein
MMVAIPSTVEEKNATMTAATAPRVAPTVGMRSAMATHRARAAANGTPMILRKRNETTPATTETAMLPET